jgi:ABC-type glycerol-3-phosphate transport system substrate-binding protein
VETAVLWTDSVEFVSYAELFNAQQEDFRIIVQYRENPAEAVSSAGDKTPDLVIGPWLKNERIRANFRSLDTLFSGIGLGERSFYEVLLEPGKIQGEQYLIPVSFNLPAVIFSTENQGLIADDFMLTLDQIRAAGAAFNKKNSRGLFTAMGFAPGWDPTFLYAAASLRKVNFREGEPAFFWNNEVLEDTILWLRDWTASVNDSVTAEDDFQFKYLYSPEVKLVTSGRCLFAYTTSHELFGLNPDNSQNIEFRWLRGDEGAGEGEGGSAGKIPLIDEVSYLGMHRKAKNRNAARAFILWFFDEDVQKSLLERAREMDVRNVRFGISGGFSSLRSVNERVFQQMYPLLLGHLPPASAFRSPSILPLRWKDMKEEIVIPYLADAVSSEEPIADLGFRINEWLKQN